ncbi:hypothetical protein NQ314_005740 [Rhamnusium bicolor]|uniref:PiggyBac transposable element-derived protein domain-containing protein n=1 Tax=Rhamnusium bicolor TaxID=1586634 RepID=A0AAV8ZGS2_9CUCU|nr:hypothetical protein NQ314_005740 [Rhamnusium bicolor]
MGDYEREVKRLENFWQEIMSDEEDPFHNDNSSDDYQPSEDSSSSQLDLQKKTPITQKNEEFDSSSYENHAAPTQLVTEERGILDNIDQSIADVVNRYTLESSSDEENDDNLSHIQWGPVDGKSLKKFDLVLNNTGIKQELYDMFERHPYDFFKLFITNDLVTYMMEQTNIYAAQTMRHVTISKKKSWKPTNFNEMEKFLGILIWMGLLPLPTLRLYWSGSFLLENNMEQVMPRNRFEQLYKMWHFNDNQDPTYDNRKITPLIKKLVDRFQTIMVPENDVCIDETLVSFRGRLKFRQYIKNKSHKFGIKLYKLCTRGGYTYNLRVYCGTDKPEEGSASANVVMFLMENILDSGRILYTDNYNTSVTLASKLLQRKTHLVGTLRSNRKFNSKQVTSKKLKKNEVFAEENGTGIVILKWKDKREVLMLSTVHNATARVKNKNGMTACVRWKSLEQEENIIPLYEETLKILDYDKLASKKSGLPLEIRSELINKYPPFANCILMEAPKLNVEVKRSVSETTIARDSGVANVQSRSCAGMSVLGGVLELLLLGDLSPETSRQLIERTSHATRIFADVHFDQS